MDKCKILWNTLLQTRPLCTSVLGCFSSSNPQHRSEIIPCTPHSRKNPFTTGGYMKLVSEDKSRSVTPFQLPQMHSFQKTELLLKKGFIIERGQTIPGVTTGLGTSILTKYALNCRNTGIDSVRSVTEMKHSPEDYLEDCRVHEEEAGELSKVHDLYCSSILKKRRKKMNKHKYRKWRKRMRFLRRKLQKWPLSVLLYLFRYS